MLSGALVGSMVPEEWVSHALRFNVLTLIFAPLVFLVVIVVVEWVDRKLFRRDG